MLNNSKSSSKTVQQQRQKRHYYQPREKRQTLTGNNISNNDSFDLLLADSFTPHLKKSIGTSKFNKVEKALYLIFRQTVLDCMSSNDSGRVVWILDSQLNDTKKKFRKTIREIANELFSVSTGNKNKVILHDKNLCKKILSSYDNEQKKKILNNLRNKSVKIQQQIPQDTEFYRHVRELVDEGLLVISPDSQNAHTCIFSNLKCIQSDDVGYDKVQMIIKKEFLDTSAIYRLHPFAKRYHKKIQLITLDSNNVQCKCMKCIKKKKHRDKKREEIVAVSYWGSR